MDNDEAIAVLLQLYHNRSMQTGVVRKKRKLSYKDKLAKLEELRKQREAISLAIQSLSNP